MLEFYVDRVHKGKMKLEDVPEKWRAKVQLELGKYNTTPAGQHN